MPPRWHREEVVLGLDVYFRHERRQLAKDHPVLERLSRELREIAPKLQPDYEPSDTFRNINGLHMKFVEYVGIDPAEDPAGTEPVCVSGVRAL